MARADLLISLVRAAANGDHAALRAAVEAMAADERSKRHGVLADRLIRALGNARVSQSSGNIVAPIPAGQSNGKDFVLETEPRRALSSLILDDYVSEVVSEVVEEQQRADVLRAYGLQPRHTLMLSGPPGNGKTSVAEAIAHDLAYPLLTVRYDALVGTYLGETNQRLRRLFDYVRSIPCVLFFDEFDAVGKERGDSQETGEIKRLVASLLLQLDDLPSYVVVVAATNHAELLDRAVWRRFEVRLELPAPSSGQVLDYISDSLRVDLDRLPKEAKAIQDLHLNSFAAASDFVLDVRRRTTLSLGTSSTNAVILERAKAWSLRMGRYDGGRSDKTSSDFSDPSPRKARRRASDADSVAAASVTARAGRSSRP